MTITYPHVKIVVLLSWLASFAWTFTLLIHRSITVPGISASTLTALGSISPLIAPHVLLMLGHILGWFHNTPHQEERPLAGIQSSVAWLTIALSVLYNLFFISFLSYVETYRPFGSDLLNNVQTFVAMMALPSAIAILIVERLFKDQQ